MFIDSHCHLNMLAQEEGGLDAVIAQAKQNQVDHIVCIAIDRSSCNEVANGRTTLP
ncbi:MAG: TatD family hydrolase [Gammaproteobacteria bacterium]|nr:TatD family hydrolase [Gammaproteobacteria bacterium]